MHCIVQLLEAGYRVRGTVRTPSREPGIREALGRALGREVGEDLSIVRADLNEDAGWPEAMAGSRYLMHVASPFPRQPPKHEDELIVPARDGTLRVLEAAVESGVETIVMTSSVAAVGYGHPGPTDRTFTEDDWTQPVKGVAPYEKSKTHAERAAWDYINSLSEDLRPKFSTICPGLTLGPVLDADYGTSGEVVRKLMRREMPGVPNFRFALVDVRDCARAHLLAMTNPAAAGQRFIVSNTAASLPEIARILERSFGPRGYRIPTMRLPDLAVRFAAIFDGTVRMALGELDNKRVFSSKRAEEVLGWSGRSTEEMAVDMGESLIRYGVV
jgi:nucleoside-diphosphate-sugar epimerase